MRCSCENQTDIEALYDLIVNTCDKPKLIISVYGGRKYFTMGEDIEREFMHSMAEAAVTPGNRNSKNCSLSHAHQLRSPLGTWMITSGLNNGTAKLIGEGVGRLRALTENKQNVTLVGMAWWGNIAEKARTMVLELQKEVKNIFGEL